MSCDKNTPQCPNSKKITKKTPECCVKHIYEMAEFISDLMKNEVYWADFGTLLGAVRNGGFIETDKDMDFGVLSFNYLMSKKSEIDKVFSTTLKPDAGVRDKVFGIKYSKANRISVDFFLFKQEGDLITRREWDKRCEKKLGLTVDTSFHKSFIKPLIEVDFGGVKLKAPNNPETFLDARYTNWRVPNKGDLGKGGAK
jgi:hypothetical protein